MGGDLLEQCPARASVGADDGTADAQRSRARGEEGGCVGRIYAARWDDLDLGQRTVQLTDQLRPDS